MLNYLFLIFYVGTVLCNATQRPNFVVILTDDQDSFMDGMTPMKNVNRLIGNEGVTFTNSYVTSPICCPSRASFLTGMYVHNHLTQNNSLAGGCYGQLWRQKEHRIFANLLKNAGYETFYAGKYMNQYGVKAAGGPELVPPGWSEWHGLVGNSVYYDFTMSNNGVPSHLTEQYLTDVIRDLSVSYIENQTESAPFLMVLAPPAPHQPFTPAPRHRDVYKNHTVVRYPNFNVVKMDKHWLLRMPPAPLPDTMLPELDRVFRMRWESLLAVDEMVADIIGALEETSKLDNTYIIFTSDNGYHIGQFAQVYDKRQPYESDIKVPLLIRGPGITRNSTNHQAVLNIDLAPTILKLADVKQSHMDGLPIDFERENDVVEERYMLIEYYGEGRDGSVDSKCPWKYDSNNLAECYPEYACKCQDSRNNTFICLRHIAEHINYKYCEFIDSEGCKELYDLRNDPYELTNKSMEEFQAIIAWYSHYLKKMIKCVGAANCNNPLDEFRVLRLM
ncbi:hypothetical protein ACJJTC_001532 [Scirpophaga incertulas]